MSFAPLDDFATTLWSGPRTSLDGAGIMTDDTRHVDEPTTALAPVEGTAAPRPENSFDCTAGASATRDPRRVGIGTGTLRSFGGEV